ncbi:acetylserotonin O-methyltransferase [Nematostella vectensis]|uniref:acetylserotonin O-methyltransferase n=1 Tax=Nematostella vectensis TaxID=45351 RepID=UPI00207771C0|nr:acetylserotonin O-methyltransferase [Nematostella vectensis]
MAESTAQHPQISGAFFDQILFGFAAPQALFTACELKIFDSLHEQPKSSSALIEQLPAASELRGLTILMDTLVTLGLLQKNTSVVPNLYENTPTADRFLVSASSSSITGFVKFVMMQQSYLNSTNFICAIKNEKALGKTWDHFYHSKEDLMIFQQGFDHLTSIEGPPLLSAFDLSAFNQVCDLGGATGRLAYEASNLYPNMKMTVFDLPQVIESASHFKPPADEYPNQDNVTLISGDFFTDELPKADLYTLRNIVHDWGDDKVDLLLEKVFKALPSGGGILLGEMLMPEDKTGHLLSNILSMIMFMFCDTGAHERTAQEYTKLLQKHGFVDVQTRSTDAALTDAILAIKP